MKKYIYTYLFMVFTIYYGNTLMLKNNFQQLISKVPISQLPIGWEETRNADSILYDFDISYPNHQIYKPFAYDTVNKYDLNDLFKFEDLEIKIERRFIWDAEYNYKYRHLHGDVYFIKRLPVIKKDEELLIYTTTLGYMPWRMDPVVPFFFLVKVNKEGKVLKTYALGGIGPAENDFIVQILFYIDKDYKIYLEHFVEGRRSESSPFSDEKAEKLNRKYFYAYKPWGSMIDLKNEK